jgi:transcriptional regulator with XRE-family HTH domain
VIIDGPAPIPPYPPAHVAFGRRLQQERISMSCALRRFAQTINWSPTSVSQVEQGDLRNALLVKTMCIKLGIDIREYEALETAR